MTNDVMQAAMATWAAKDIPARLDVATTARILGFPEHDIQILMASRKLTPLGDPAPNAPKWFAAIQVIRLAADEDWLNKATKEVAKYWRHKRERRENPRSAPHRNCRETVAATARKVTPDSSPKPSPSEQFAGDERAIASGE
jgi:hypothetical protein